ncbi:MAG: hypothetical protein H6585_00055 [Flavobacteriales bacterium]|nr:hypothetical protein [Flavobacteriales bacterium]MCB9446716.1 hypothetical protein [Flavobacteriales bacterium]
MKKPMHTFTLLLICFFAIPYAHAQQLVLSEDFTTYEGTEATLPAGWFASRNGMYSSASSCGASGPNSFKFDGDGTLLVFPRFEVADSLSFWIKGNSLDSLSVLYVNTSADSLSWETMDTVILYPTRDSIMQYRMPGGMHYVNLTYVKSKGNLALDDIRMYGYFTGGGHVPGPHPAAICQMYNGVHLSGPVNAKGDVRVYDLSGRCIRVWKDQPAGSNLSFDGLSSGIWMVVWNTPSPARRMCLVP